MTTKKQILTFILGLSTVLSFSYAGDVTVKGVDGIYGSCSTVAGETVDKNYYLTDSYDTHFYDDAYVTNRDAIVRGGSSRIEVWSGGVISNCDDWVFASNFIPKSSTSNPVLYRLYGTSVGNPCKISTPSKVKTNSETIDAQIRFIFNTSQIFEDYITQDYLTATKKWTALNTNGTSWKCLLSLGNYSTVANQADCNSKSIKYSKNLDNPHNNECINIRTFRCGDGLINGYKGAITYSNTAGIVETCDPNAPGRSSETCNPQTCQPIPSEFLIQKDVISPANGVIAGVGDEVIWQITITASGGVKNLSGYDINDYLPREFEPISATLVSPTPSTITIANTYIQHLSDVADASPQIRNRFSLNGILQAGESAVIQFKTKLDHLPTDAEWQEASQSNLKYGPNLDQNYYALTGSTTNQIFTNLACIAPSGASQDVRLRICDPAEVKIIPGDYQFVKTSTTPSVSNIGDQIDWVLTWTNTGTSTAYNLFGGEIIKNSDYITFDHFSDAVWTNPSTPSQINCETSDAMANMGFKQEKIGTNIKCYISELKPGQSVSIILHTVVKSLPNDKACFKKQIDNCASRSENNIAQCDTKASVPVLEPELLVAKRAITPEVTTGGQILEREITYTASGSLKVAEFYDHILSGQEFITGEVTNQPADSRITFLGLETSGLPSMVAQRANRKFEMTSGYLLSGQSFTIKIKTKLLEFPATAAQVGNRACSITCYQPCAIAGIPVKNAPILTGDYTITKTALTSGYSHTGDVLTYEISFKATSGTVDLTNKFISDEISQYVAFTGSYQIIKNGSKSEVISMDTANVDDPHTGSGTIKWNLSGSLSAGEEISIRYSTYVYQLPPYKADGSTREDIPNLACIEDLTTLEKECSPAKVPYISSSYTITKTALTSGYSHTGDVLTYEISFKATSGTVDLTNKFISDEISQYVAFTGSYQIIKNGSKSEIISMDTANVDDPHTGSGTIKWNLSGSLSAGEEISIRYSTYVYQLPPYKADGSTREDIPNLACIEDLTTLEKECSPAKVPPIPTEGDLRCVKTFTDGTVDKEFRVGDLVSYIIRFGNDGSADLAGSIWDLFPLNLEFVSAQAVISNSGVLGGVPIYTRDDLSFPANSSGYILLTGRVTTGRINTTLNVAVLYTGNVAIAPNNPQGIKCENTPIYRIVFDKMLGFDKEILPGSPNTIASGGTTDFVLRVKNLGTSVMTGFTVTDTLPDGLEFVSNTNGHELFTFSQNGKILTWADYTGSLAPNEGVNIVFKVRATKVSPTSGDRENRACLTHPDFPSWKPTTNAYTIDQNCNPEVVTVTTGDVPPDPQTAMCNSSYDGKTFETLSATDPLCNPSSVQATNFLTDPAGLGWTWTCGQYQCSALKTNTPPSTPSLKITKQADKTDYTSSDTVIFTLTVDNIGQTPLSNITVTDVLPDGLRYLNTVSANGFSQPTVSNQQISRVYTNTLGVNQSAQIRFSATITANTSSSQTTTLTHLTNWACMTHSSFPSWQAVSNSRENCDNTVITIKSSNVFPYCGDGKAEAREDCDCGNGLSGNTTCDISRATIKPGLSTAGAKTCEVCKIKSDDKYLVDPISCFNTNNGSISINLGETLPFYRNIEKLDSDSYVSTRTNRTTIEEYEYLTKISMPLNSDLSPSDYKNTDGQSCSDYEIGDIALNAMVCTFKIYNGKNTQQNSNNAVYSLRVPCFTEKNGRTSAWSNSELVRSLFNSQNNWSLNPTRDTSFAFQSSIFAIPNFGKESTSSNYRAMENGLYYQASNPINDTLGEYKISLDRVDYAQCIPSKSNTNDRVWVAMNPYPRVCEVDFALTEPYLIQKTPAGNTTASSEQLRNFLFIDGVQTYDASSLLSSILSVGTDTYTSTPQVKTAMDDFIRKYSKLAVSVSSSKIGNGVKKVPGKEIYFIDGNLDITSSSSSVPFTIVNTNPNSNITIRGNLNHNLMLLTEGSITFDASDSCNQTQTVKGVFYSKAGFKSINDFRNNTQNQKRCDYGNLHIQGVLISDKGDSITNLVNLRRSELNYWFHTPSGERPTQTQRQDYIMNGASLLIEYSPSLFTTSTMSPGAQDFTNALSVYRQHGSAPTIILDLLGGLIQIPIVI